MACYTIYKQLKIMVFNIARLMKKDALRQFISKIDGCLHNGVYFCEALNVETDWIVKIND